MGYRLSRTRLYSVWSGMKDRCYNKNCKAYKNYGGRGIFVCDEWIHDFLAFRKWAMETGYDETAPRGQYTIERKDNDGPYSPDNCRWATIQEQLCNRRNNIKVDVDGKKMVLSEACGELGIKYNTVLRAVRRRSQGAVPRAEYIAKEKEATMTKAEILHQLMKQHPEWTNAQLASHLNITVRTVQRLKKVK